MKNSKTLFIIALVALVVLLVLALMRMPKRFTWHTTFAHNDEQPFGCAVFDSVMSASAPAGYEVSGMSLYQMSDYVAPQCNTYLLVENYWGYSDTEAKSILRMLKRGDNVVLAVHSAYSSGNDVMYERLGLAFRYNADEFDGVYSFPRHYADSVRDKVTWVGTSRQPRTTYVMHTVWSSCNVICPYAPKNFVNRGYWKDERRQIEYRVLARRGSEIVALSATVGRGRLIVTTMPHLFSNYGVLDTQMRELGMRVLSQAGRHPIVRIDENYDKGDVTDGGASRSPLKYLLDNPPLRWALYLTLATVLLFFVFTARRRQRVIPVMSDPEDQSMALVEHIGTLYYERHDNADLLQKKYQYFTERLRREAVVDIDDEEHFDSELATLAQLTGLKSDQLLGDLTQIRAALEAHQLSDPELKLYIGMMNKILEKI